MCISNEYLKTHTYKLIPINNSYYTEYTPKYVIGLYICILIVHFEGKDITAFLNILFGFFFAC